MSVWSRGGAVAALIAFSACGERSSLGAEEVAGELRALRLAMAARSEGAAGSDALRGQLVALAAAQRATEARQAELQRDLASWLQAAAGDASARRAEEARQLQQRLDDLELALRQQRDRQRALEDALLQGIERAGQRIDGMLDRLAPLPSAAPVGAEGAGSATDATAVPAKAPEPASAGAPAGGKVQADAAAPDAAAGGAASAATARVRAVWVGLAALGAISASWWIRREVLAARRERVRGPSEGVPTDSIAAFEALAAAAAGALATPQPRDAGPGAPEALAGRPGDVSRWLVALAAEPAVLREPPPQAICADGRGEVRYWLRPDTSAAARLRLRLRLLRPQG
jgi:hypothetical protein